MPEDDTMSDTNRETIFDRAEQAVYDRSEKHDDPEDSFERIADLWSGYLNYSVNSIDVANMMILLKVARSAEGYYNRDNWVDIAGYAECADRTYWEETTPRRSGSRPDEEPSDDVVYEDEERGITITGEEVHRP